MRLGVRDQVLEAFDRLAVRCVQLAVDCFFLVVEQHHLVVEQVGAEVRADDLAALAAGRRTEESVRVDDVAAPFEEGDPRLRMESHVVDDGAVHVEDQRALGLAHAPTPCFSEAEMKSSRSPSSTFLVLPVSKPVRKSLMRDWSST